MALFRGGDMWRFPYLLIFFLFISPDYALSATYTWIGVDSNSFSTPTAACQSIGGRQGYSQAFYSLSLESRAPQYGQPAFNCVFTAKDSPFTVYRNVGYTYRVGDSCPLGTEYDSGSGSCVAPLPPGGDQCGESSSTGPRIYNSSGQCVSVFEADTPSQCKYLSKSTRVARVSVQFGDDGKAIQPPPVVNAGCTANVISVEHCKAPVKRKSCGSTGLCIELQSNFADCKVGLDFTGDPAPSGDPVPWGATGTGADGVCPDGDCVSDSSLPNVTESQPCSYVTDSANPSGASTCSSWNFAATPGEARNCGSVNGVFQCLGKPPASQGWQIDTTVETAHNGDGTTTETKTDVHNETKCIGANACVTKTTTNKSVTIKGSNGETLGQSSECTGANCASGGSGGKGDSDGDGISDCAQGGDCTGEEDSGSQGPGCTGDDCGFVGPDGLGDDIPTFSDSFQSMYSGVMSSPIVSAVTSIQFPSGGVAPTGGVEVLGVNISFDSYIDLWLQIAPILSPVFLAVWCLLAIRILFSA